MADCISREAALAAMTALRQEDIEAFGMVIPECFPSGRAIEALNAIPAADVRPVAEISDAVDEVLDFLNENSNCMPYHIYSALFDLVSGICPNCGADMREGRK